MSQPLTQRAGEVVQVDARAEVAAPQGVQKRVVVRHAVLICVREAAGSGSVHAGGAVGARAAAGSVGGGGSMIDPTAAQAAGGVGVYTCVAEA